MSLRTDNISVRYGEHVVLKDVSADIPQGKITAILGPNGAGKTTLLRILSGDQTPDAGTVFLNDMNIATLSATVLAKHRAVLPQQTRPAFGFKSWEMVQLGRSPFGDSEATALKFVEDALMQVDAMHLAERDVNTLSGGERQRIFLAKALCQAEGHGDKSGFLLLDEPAAALDPKQANRLMRILKTTAERGIGVGIIAHDIHAMRRHADRFLLIANGKLKRCEKSRDLTPEQLGRLYDVEPDEFLIRA